MLHTIISNFRRQVQWYHIVQVWLIALSLLTFRLNAQEPYVIPDPEDPVYEAPDPNSVYEGDFDPSAQLQTCDAPRVLSQSVIHYNGFILVHLSFQGLRSPSLLLNVLGAEGSATQVTAVENQLFMNTLAPNTLYELKALNTCNAWVTIAGFSTYRYNRGSGIEVSDQMFRALADYTQTEAQQTGLHVYLQNLQSVDLFERTAFAQRYFLGGAPLPDNTVGTYPMQAVQEAITLMGGENRECLCEYTISRGAFAVPDGNAYNLDVDEKTSGGNGPMEKNGKWWINLTDEGAAKKYEFYSDGVKNGSAYLGKDKIYGIQGQSETKSPNFAMHNYQLVCVNFPNSIPAGCECTRTVRAIINYDAEVDVMANTVSKGMGKKRSAALAQECAVAFTVKQTGSSIITEIVDAGLVSAGAKCEAGIPAMAIVDGALLVAQVVTAIQGSFSSSFDPNSNEWQGIRNGIETYMDKYFQEYNCESGSNKQTLIQKELVLPLEANKPIGIGLSSGTALKVNGKRSWKSHAKSKSSFHLTSVVLGGNSGSEESFCCSDYTAQWVWAGQLNDDQSLITKVKNFVGFYLPSSLNRTVNDVPVLPNTLPITTEIGRAVGDFTGCRYGEIIIETNPR